MPVMSGLMGCVLDFNRLSGLVVALARRWLGIPVLGFYDDFKLTELACSPWSADEAFQGLLSFLGLALDSQKRQAPSVCTTFLGTQEIFSSSDGAEQLGLIPTPQRIASVLAELQRVLSATTVSTGQLATLRGFDFAPFGLESYGAWGPAANESLRRLGKHARTGGRTDTRAAVGWCAPHIAEVARQWVSVAVQRGNGRLLLDASAAR